ncbi:MAG: hypothetical protein JOZ56_04330 [Actinobacteria bacterium]|nr:hypothetical protein [Actinomycetota bacterium]MBV8562295.1 hypothetical protein [Actinomycetota bacterium]
MKKQPRVPGMRENTVKPNRQMRRHPQGLPEDQPLTRDAPLPSEPDVSDVRAKTTGHGKKTADKWNQ